MRRRGVPALRAVALPLLILAASAAPLSAQRTASVRAVARVPAVLHLTEERSEGGTASSRGAPAERLEEVRLHVRANLPWRLRLSLGPSAGGDAMVRVVDVRAVRNAIAAPDPGLVPAGEAVEVARSAERGDAVISLRVAWSPQPDRPRPVLLYSLAAPD